MPTNPISGSDGFLLGEIKATVVGTADDVKAIRLDIGGLASRVGGIETRVEAIEAEREVLVPQYSRWKHDISNDVQVLQAWRHQQEGAVKGLSLGWKIATAILTFLGGSGAVIGYQALEGTQRLAKTETRVAGSPSPSSVR